MESAVLRGANLEGANLKYAVLRGANLEGIILSGADLSLSDLSDADLRSADLRSTNLYTAVLHSANLEGANLSGANLSRANLNGTNFRGANLSRIDFSEKDLTGANFSRADLTGVDLQGANLKTAIFVETNLENASLTNCLVYGVSAWDVQLRGAIQQNLVITLPNKPTITIDNLKLAQFIYLLLHGEEVRDAIDTITSKVVLILGRFTPERKGILDTIREELRKYNYLPTFFDFDVPRDRDLTETISTLAHLSRFIIVDLTDLSGLPYEIVTVASNLVIPVQPLLLQDDTRHTPVPVMFQDRMKRYHWILPICYYKDPESLLAVLREHVIEPAEHKLQGLARPHPQ